MSGGVENKQFWRLCAIYCGLIIITLVLYWPATGHDFVNYDDPDYVTANAHVQTGLNQANLIWAFTTGHASNWHPLAWISHMTDCSLYGLKPAGHHLTNILLHIANAALLFGVLFELTGTMWASAFVAALFSWHPVHVESVAWISERKDVLSTLFWLLTMLEYGFYAKSKKPIRRLHYTLALIFFTLGLLSKPMLVTLPCVLLLLDFWPLARLKKSNETTGASTKNVRRTFSWSRLFLEKIPFFVLAIISCAITFLVQKRGGAVSSLNVLPINARLANAVISYLRYVGKIFWPTDLAVMYPHPGTWPVSLLIAALFFVIATTIVVVFVRRHHPYLFVGWFWFLGTLVPVIGLVQVGMQSMADRYTYIPAIGIFVILAWGAAELFAKQPRNFWLPGAIAVPVLLVCCLLTIKQVGYWRNSETLFRHVVSATANNFLAYNNLGYFLEKNGHSDEAFADYEKAVSINPNYEEAQNNLGHLLAGKHQLPQAIACYEAALRIKPNLVEAHNNLGNALSSLGRLDDAIAEYQLALQFRPEDEDAHNNLGIARAMQGRLDEAAELLTEAVRLKPTDAGAHSNLGNVYAAQHRLDDAVRQFQLSIQLNPHDAQARNNLGNVFSEQNKLDQATDSYLEALRLNPINPEANFNLGVVELRQGKFDSAKKHFAEAVRLKPDYTAAQRELDKLK